MSPSWSCSLAAIFLKILLIIFPDLVFGSPGLKWIKSGVAKGPICFLTHNFRSLSRSPVPSSPAGEEGTGDLERDLKLWVRKQIGPLATPDLIHFSPGLPKTRSGKIMRRILRKIAANEHDQLGDTTTLADPSVVTSLVENRKNI